MKESSVNTQCSRERSNRSSMKPAPRLRTWIVSRIRLLTFSGVLALLLTQAGNPQQNFDPPRVALDFRCPTYVLAGNAPITMHAEVMGARGLLDEEQAKRIRFKWQLSGAKLLTGQGSGKIIIDPAGLQTPGIGCIDVKLEVEGGPPDLQREKTCLLRVDPKCNAPQIFDQYGGVAVIEERQHLDHFAKYLKDTGPESIAYIISYSGRSACIYEAQWRANRAKRYLIEKHSLPKDRIVEVDGGVRENWNVDLFIQTRGTCGPLPTPTLARDEAHVRGQCSDTYKESESR